jgi:hypothetical protein
MRRLIPMPSPHGINREGFYIPASYIPAREMAYDSADGRAGHYRILSDAEALRYARRLTRRLLAKDQESEGREASEAPTRSVQELSDYAAEAMTAASL